jgi:hypothetical protein
MTGLIITGFKIKMKLGLPECNIPPRFLIGLQNSKSILLQCARHKVAYVLGFLVVVTAVIVIGYFRTKDDPTNSFQVPLWLCFLPAVFFFLYAGQSSFNVERDTSRDAIEYQLSGMTKKDFLTYKVGDDRAATSFLGSATSAGILSGVNLLGPFLRADR